MIAIDTEHHITYSSTTDLPYKTCSGKCRKAWWKFDFEARSSKHCPQCGGKLRPVAEGKHFRVIETRPGKLQESDLSQYQNEEGNSLFDSQMFPFINLQHVSIVKPEFAAKAKQQWA
ncbi:hypothetical protein [Neptuniibacter halophilus]|uniref:hypothetical protein n=1 Tax=Neptuniibacter halophilus TaxID=651666 RepID=UPI002572C5C8|nr:hypothetical protein [Neptuniibacter halophilus]